jgi:hypothetical protein
MGEEKMTLLQPLATYVKKYPLVVAPLHIEWWGEWSTKVQQAALSLYWDPSYTTVTKAQLVLKMTSDHGNVDCYSSWDGSLLPYASWGPGEHGLTKIQVLDIVLVAGTHLLEMWLHKNAIYFEAVNVQINEAYLEVTYEGIAPDRPLDEIIWEWFKVNWPYVAIVGAMMIGGVWIYKTIKR